MIRRAAENPVISTTVLLAIVFSGALSFFLVRRQTFTTFSLDLIQVSVEHRGASPEDIEEGICSKIEDEIQGIEGIKRIESTSVEGFGVVLVHLKPDVKSVSAVRSEIETEINRIDFPEDAERPVVVEKKVLEPVIQLAIKGDVGETNRKLLAEEIRDELLKLPGISQVEIFGTRDYRVRIQVSSEELERLGLTFDQVVAKIQAESVDLPAGSIRSKDREVSVRTRGKRRKAEDFRRLVLISPADGNRVMLGQVARVEDAYEEDEIHCRFDGEPCVNVYVYRTSDEDTVKISQIVNAYVEEKRKHLPSGVELDLWFDGAPRLHNRLQMIYDNAWQGLIFVFVSLILFMGFRTSFWVAAGVPIACVGTVAIMQLLGVTINMISTFGFVIVLGMLVDDGIVIADNVQTHYMRGASGHEAAIAGTSEVAIGVFASSLTTIAAFMPMMFVAGDMGKMMKDIPLVVSGALLVSFIEAMLCLPGHLGHSLPKTREPGQEYRGVLGKVHKVVDSGLNLFLDHVFQPVLKVCLRFRGATAGLALGAIFFAIALCLNGTVDYVIFPEMDADYIRCRFELAPGTPVERTEEVTKLVEEATKKINEEHGGKVFRHLSATSGSTTGPDAEQETHYGEIIAVLYKAGEGRPLHSRAVKRLWREIANRIPGVQTVTFANVDTNPAASPFEVRLKGNDIEDLRRASSELQAELRTYQGVVDATDDDDLGKLEYQYALKPRAATHGVTVLDLARQLREGYFGETAVTLQRGREDVDVVVVLPEEKRKHEGNLEDFKIRTPLGIAVPIEQLAQRKLVRSVRSIKRVDRTRAITVTAGLDEDFGNCERILSDMEKKFFPHIQEKHPGVEVYLGGQREQSRDSLMSILVLAIVAMGLVFLIIALTFRSFLQAAVVMSIIPLSFLGSIFGLWLFGHGMSLLAMAGLVGVMGVVVNDSIVAVEFYNDAVARGVRVKEALLGVGKARFRPIFLTSETTFVGLISIMLEKSGEAQFLVPVAVAIGWGLASETVFILLVTPALLWLVNDLKRLATWLTTGVFPAAEDVEPAVQHAREREAVHAPEEPVELPEELAAFAAPPPRPAAASPLPASEEPIARQAPGERPAAPWMPGPRSAITAAYRRFKGADRCAEEAGRLAEQDDIEGACACYLAALRSEPDRKEFHVALAMLRLRAQDWDGAKASFDRAIQLDPDDLDIREYRGYVELKKGDYESAIEDLSARLRMEPDHLIALKGRASALAAAGRTDEALEDLDRALRVSPKNVDLHYLRGNVLRAKKKHKQAIEDYDFVLGRRPNHARALMNRGLARESRGESHQARSDFEAAWAADPDLDEALYNLGRALLAEKELDQAVLRLSEYLTLHPERSRAYLHRGKARSLAGDRSGAASDFRRFLELEPKAPERKMVLRFIKENAPSGHA